MRWATITEAHNILGLGEPWEHGALGPRMPILHPIRVVEHTSRHCFSACLFREPTFEKRFPTRDYRERYLERCHASGEALTREGHHLNIICDQESLDDALSLGIGSVFVCHDDMPKPFTKHVFRYYSTLLPRHPTVEFWHFRGMDNILKSDDEPRLIEEFERSGCDLLRSPYFPFKVIQGKRYIRVRGSCSVNLRGAASLAHFLTSVPILGQPGAKAFHCDEIHLDKWFQRDWRYLKTFTLVDRSMYPAFYEELREMVDAGAEQIIRVKVAKKGTGPMSSAK